MLQGFDVRGVSEIAYDHHADNALSCDSRFRDPAGSIMRDALDNIHVSPGKLIPFTAVPEPQVEDGQNLGSGQLEVVAVLRPPCELPGQLHLIVNVFLVSSTAVHLQGQP